MSEFFACYPFPKGLGRFAGSNDAREALVAGLSDSDAHVRRSLDPIPVEY